MAKDMDALKPGEYVQVQPFQPNTLWNKARVNTSLGNRSYEVELDTGTVLRRNHRHLRKAMERDTDLSKHPRTDTQCHTVPIQSTVSPQGTTTRSGHTIQQPQYLRDYECT